MISINLLIFSSIINNSIPSSKIIKNNDIFFDFSKKLLITEQPLNDKIGIVDFRYILKKSNAMKILGNKFLYYENKINKKFKQKQIELKDKEKQLKKDKTSVTDLSYKNKLKFFKQEVLIVQKNYKNERTILNKSFQKIQNKIKDLLAQVIKEVSIKKNINVVFLKENIFLFNNTNIDFTSDALDMFNQKTKSLKIIITPFD